MNIEIMKGCVTMSTKITTYHITRMEVNNSIKRAKGALFFDPCAVDVKHFDGQTKPIDLYYIASCCYFRTLKRSLSKRAVELFERAFTTCLSQTQDYVQGAVSSMICGYTNGKGVFFDGYMQGENTYRQLCRIAYKSINAMLKADGVQGANIGRVQTLGNKTVPVNIFGYAYINRSHLNKKRFDRFMDDIKKRIVKVSTLEIFERLIEGDYTQILNSQNRGSFDLIALTADTNYSRSTVKRALSDIKKITLDVISVYNVAPAQLMNYLSA